MQVDRLRQLTGALVERGARHADKDSARHCETIAKSQVTEILVDCDEDTLLRNGAIGDGYIVNARTYGRDFDDVMTISGKACSQAGVDTLVDEKSHAMASRS